MMPDPAFQPLIPDFKRSSEAIPMDQHPQVPPGWYPDPAGRQSFRWWNGTSWTAHVSPGTGEVAQEDIPGSPDGDTSTISRDDKPAEPSVAAEKTVSAHDLVKRARALRSEISGAVEAPSIRFLAARHAYEAVRDDLVRQQLATLPLKRLRESTQGRLRLGVVESAGYRTVGQAAAAGRFRLEQIPGVGPQTASQVIAAANQLKAAMTQSARVRFDTDTRPFLQAKLLEGLHAYEAARRSIAPISEGLNELAVDLDAVLAGAGRAASRLKMFFTGPRKREQARSDLGRLDALMQASETTTREAQLKEALVTLGEVGPDVTGLWKDYENRAVVYNGLLIEVGELGADVQASQGFIPAEIAQRVNQQPLDLSLMRASLRGYQAFGAKFSLAQGKAILGDEMGLGKSVEALAAMCHLRLQEEKHFLVVCPASVLVNWAHEIRRHSELMPYRLHGADRQRNSHAWARLGGVAVTTYDSLRSLPNPNGMHLGMLVVDEAHYTKNPTAERTKAVRDWIIRTRRVLFLTGTPMENRVEEFRTLVGHLRPDLAYRISAIDGLVGAQRFRQAVAPVYLRRNQSDVLEELPPRLDTEEWVALGGAALITYREAVASGNFMAMRRAAFAPGNPADSAKLSRLLEIVEEAAANGRKSVVFSFFRDVLGTVASFLGEIAIGPLTGSVSPVERQRMVDQFTAHPGPAALVSQIQAGGVGLNIQAASVVILTEPQWKPTIEDQAIARCHRMGQVRRVDVHRLLAEDSVDQRMLEILAAKTILFDEYVRRSELKDMSPDAVDISDINEARKAGTQAQAEYRIIEMERKRLHLESVVSVEPGQEQRGTLLDDEGGSWADEAP
jgi:superfamily II DNA or RNA helicase